MAVTKTLTVAVPFNLNSKVQKWEFEMKYEEGSNATYYTSTFHACIHATDPSSGEVNFTPKAEASWTLAELTALCPTDKWDGIFDSQYDSVITNPPDDPIPDPSYVIPS
jgi:hypothetical protein